MKIKLITRLFLCVLLFIACLCPERSYADEALLSPEYTNCVDSHQSNSEWAGCGYEEIKKQDQLLNEVWKKISLILKEWASSKYPYPSCSICGSDQPFASLLEEQRNWIKWKDSACEFWMRGGFGRETEVLTYPSCKATVIAQRVVYLTRLTKVLEEDLHR